MSNTRTRMGHVATLDVLRFGGALAVLLYHYAYRGAQAPVLSDVSFENGAWLRHLYLAVHMFFAISGFVILASVRGRDAVAFGVARFVRLWPAYAVCSAITLATVALTGDTRFPASWEQWGANLLFVAPAFGQPFADGAYWSIVVELVFYAWVAAMILLRVLPRHVLLFCAAWLSVAAVNEVWALSEPLRHLLVTRHAPWFVYGMVVYYFVTRGHSVGAWAVALAAVALSMHNAAGEQIEIATRYGEEPDRAGIVLANGAVLVLFAFAVHWRHLLRPRPWLLALGALTYPLYLLHQHLGYIAMDRLAPVLDALAPGAGRYAALALVMAGAVALAWAVERCLERPMRRLLRQAIEALLAPVNALLRRSAPRPV